VHILVAKDRIPAGTSGARIRADALVAEVVVPASTVSDDALSAVPAELDKLAGVATAAAVAAGPGAANDPAL
jgi:pilus assembly protein CpaB